MTTGPETTHLSAAPVKPSTRDCVGDSSPVPPAGEAPARQTASRTLADLARQAEQFPINWLVPFTLIEGGIHVVYGKEGSFKTTLVMQLLAALSVGGPFLDWKLAGGLRVGFAELEMTEQIFCERALRFLRSAQKSPDIAVLSSDQRRKILGGSTAKDRVRVLWEWVEELNLDVLAVDSAAKLFPPGANPNSQPEVSDVFNQLQNLGCTVVLIAHPRKGDPKVASQGNDEIAGSGRFAQDPDIVLEVRRPDKRAPKAVLSWGKNRMDSKPEDLEMFFDCQDFRLYPRHPFLHLLPATRDQLLAEAEARYGWKRSRADAAIAELKALRGLEDEPLVEEAFENREAVFRLKQCARVGDSGKVAEPGLGLPAPKAPLKIVERSRVKIVLTFPLTLRVTGHRPRKSRDDCMPTDRPRIYRAASPDFSDLPSTVPSGEFRIPAEHL